MITSDIVRHGNILFRYRSFLPFLVLPLALYYLYASTLHHYIPEGYEYGYLMLCLSISLAGFALRCITVGSAAPNTSGRNTTQQKADSLNTSGMYSIVRHPLYFANYITFAGFLMAMQSLSFFMIGTLIFFVYYERIAAAEENFLAGKFGEAYKNWANKTPAFFPNPFQWQIAERPLSFRRILRKEGPGLLLICAYFPLVEFLEDVVFDGESALAWLHSDGIWLGLVFAGLTIHLTLLILRKRTTLLDI